MSKVGLKIFRSSASQLTKYTDALIRHVNESVKEEMNESS